MKKIKKVLLLLVLIFGIALASCGEKKVDGSLTINYGLGMETKKVTASEYNKDLLTVEKEGYKFLGWYLDTSYSKVYVSEDKISGDVSIYAKWETIKYDITYHLDGGTNNSNNPAKYTVEDKVTLLDPTKEECTFKGWYTEESLTNKVSEIAKNTTGNKDFYAKWEEASLAVEYDITYDLNGGTNASTNPSKYTSEDEVILARPSKNGFTFAGWMLETGAPITKIEKGTTGPIVLIATWTQDVLISFVVDNETVKMVNITNGEQVTLPSNPSKTGYDFAGWYVGENEFNAQQTITESVTVTAKFTVQKFDVKFYSGTTLVDTIKVEYNNPTNALPQEPTKTGYEFKGWYLADGTEFNAKTTLVTTSLDVTAKFELVQYNIIYNLNGGTNNAANPLTYTVKDTIELKDPTKDNCTFAGWVGKAGEPISNTIRGSVGDIYLTAKWTNDILVTFVVDNETVKTVNITKNEQLTLPTEPKKEGYDFDGWYVGENEFNAQQTITESVTVTAKFTIKEFDVKFYVDNEVWDTIKVEYNNPTDSLPEEPSKENYSFKGWFLADGTEFNPKTTIITDDLNVYAKFEDPSVSKLKVTECVGANEAIYLKMNVVEDFEINDYKVYYSLNGNYVQIDSQLVRKVSDEIVRADIVGLKEGTYNVKVDLGEETVLKNNIVVSALDRSGYAHFNYEDGVGAYNDDGTLKAGATIIYVSDATKNTVTHGNYAGIVQILKNLKNISTPVVIRFLDMVQTTQWDAKSYTQAAKSEALKNAVLADYKNATSKGGKYYIDKLLDAGANTINTDLAAGITTLNGLEEFSYGTTTDSYWNMCDIEFASNVTIEGIGENAGLYQWGLTWKKCSSIEVRNLKFDKYTEDACSFENLTDSSDLSAYENVGRFWVHNNTFTQGLNRWDVSDDQDKHEGDGATDFKRTANITLSYNHYIENHKTGLIGSDDNIYTANVTFHHNYYDRCSSRMPLGRNANMHMYNNYYYGTTGTNMSIRARGYAFVENCVLENTKNPFECVAGKAEKGMGDYTGAIKSYNNQLINCSGKNNSMPVTDRTTSVSNFNSYGQTFDTDSTIFYYDSINQKSNVSILNDTADVPTFVALHAGSGSGYYSPLELYSTVIVKHTVTFKYSDGTTVKDYGTLAVADGASAAEPEFDIEGYTLVGWYSDSDLTKSFSFNTEITDDITVYAKVNALEAFVVDYIYNVGDGDVAISSTTVYDGEKVAKPSDPKLSGYLFKGWYTSLSYEAEFDFATAITKATTIYAKFEESVGGYVINFNDIDEGDKTADFNVTNALVKATSQKKVSINTCTETLGGLSINRVLKLGGTPTSSYRSIHFTLAYEADIIAYYKSSNSSEARKLALYNSNGKVNDFELAENDIISSSLTKIPAGEYYIGSANIGVNVYAIVIQYYSGSSNPDPIDYEDMELCYYYTARNTLKNTSYNNGQYPAMHVKTIYKVGDQFDSTYLSAIIDNQYITTGFTFSGFDSSTTGKKTITVTYGNYQGTFDVYVLAADFEVASNDKGYYAIVSSNYVVGETFESGNTIFTKFKTINQALEALEMVTPTATKRAYLQIAAGYYNEKVVINVPYLTITGSGIAKATYELDESYDAIALARATVIEWNSIYGTPTEGNGRTDDQKTDVAVRTHVTDSTQTVYITEKAINCEIESLTISNANNCYSYFTNVVKSHAEHRALALLVQADMVRLTNVALLGYQDTVEFFTGRHFLDGCYISGATDYIFGTNGTTFIQGSIIHTVYNGSNTQGGYVNAFKGQNPIKDANYDVQYGCIYDGCTFEADSKVADGIIALGRPWTESSSVMIMNSSISAKYSKASTASSSVGRYCDWNSNIKAANAKFYEYNNTGEGAITVSVTGCTVITDATEAAKYNNLDIIFGKTNGNVKYDNAWDGSTKPIVDTNIYYYFDGTATSNGYTFTTNDNVNGTTGTFGNMTIDATNGKLEARSNDTQMNAGTVITFTVTKAAKVTITFNHWQEAYTVNGVASTDGVYSIDVEANTTITFVATAKSYLKSIIIS